MIGPLGVNVGDLCRTALVEPPARVGQVIDQWCDDDDQRVRVAAWLRAVADDVMSRRASRR